MQTAIITGAASGIGLELTKAYINEGYNVVMVDINEEKLKSESANFNKEQVLTIKCDVTKEDDIKNVVDSTLSHFDSIDVLINNAGLQHVSMIEDFPSEKFEMMINIMLVAPFKFIKYVSPIMKKQNYGRILNMSSINGVIGFSGKSAYNSAKHGLIGLTKVAALELATNGITVNAICPGYIDTPLVRGQMEDLAKTRNVSVEQVLDEVIFPLVPQKKLIDIKEICDYCIFLSKETTTAVTGQSIIIDGGYTAQ